VLIELGIIGLISLAAWQATKPGPGIMTPQRRLIFRHALNKIDPPLSPEALNELADIFDKEGLTAYSEILRMRARLRARPPELKQAYRSAFTKGMNSKDPLAVRALATAFESQGMVANAATLRNYAIGLDAAALAPGSADAEGPAPPSPPAVAPSGVESTAVTGDTPPTSPPVSPPPPPTPPTPSADDVLAAMLALQAGADPTEAGAAGVADAFPLDNELDAEFAGVENWEIAQPGIKGVKAPDGNWQFSDSDGIWMQTDKPHIHEGALVANFASDKGGTKLVAMAPRN